MIFKKCSLAHLKRLWVYVILLGVACLFVIRFFSLKCIDRMFTILSQIVDVNKIVLFVGLNVLTVLKMQYTIQ